MKIHVRELTDSDFNEMRALLLSDGPNEWNQITDESIEFQFRLVREGKALAVLAEGDDIVGFAILVFGKWCPQKFSKYDRLSSLASIKDVVVRSSESGKGLGSKLLLEAVAQARKALYPKVYIERHEENMASAGMMRKAGFVLVEAFLDEQKRMSGSRRTAVLVADTQR